MASVEGLGLQAPSWLVSVKSGKCRAFRVPQRQMAGRRSSSSLWLGVRPIEYCGSRRAVGIVTVLRCFRYWLIAAAPRLEREVFWSVASLLDLEVDLLFFDSTSTYFGMDEGDEPVLRDDRGQPSDSAPADDARAGAEPGRRRSGRRRGRRGVAGGVPHLAESKDARGDPPQIVIGIAVTVRVWSWPSNTVDSALIRQAKADLREWADPGH